MAERFLHCRDEPRRGRLVPALRASNAHGLACDDAGDGVALHHRIGVHHPGHHLLVRVDVRGRYIRLRPYYYAYFVGVSSGEPFYLVPRHYCRVAGDPALGPAKGQVNYAALPCHESGQSGYLVEVNLRVVPYAAFCRAPREVVLHPVSGKKADCAVVHLHRHRDDERASRRAEPLVDGNRQIQMPVRVLEVFQYFLEKTVFNGHVVSLW